MASPVAQSANSVAFSSTTNVVIPKPTGLTAGDLMFAAVCAGATGMSAPGGWSTAHAEGSVSDGDPRYLSCFYKIADSSDASATNFTFTGSGTDQRAGIMVRIDGFNSANPLVNSSEGSQVDMAGNVSFSGFTPAQENTLLIFVTTSVFCSNGANTSSYAIATDNPTWTEQADLETDTGNNYSLALATGPRTQLTATGTATATIGTAGGVPENDSISQLFAIGGIVDKTVALSVAEISVVAGNITTTLIIPISGVTITVNAGTLTVVANDSDWSNTAKNSASMTNTSKNSATFTNTSKNSGSWTNTSKS